tara:strand:+ start:1997 stop:2224 length:228 start_codon:yes stop_codon:yes gene_type:complete
MIIASSLKLVLSSLLKPYHKSIFLRRTAFLLPYKKQKEKLSNIFKRLEAPYFSNKKIKSGLLIIIMRPKASLTYC